MESREYKTKQRPTIDLANEALVAIGSRMRLTIGDMVSLEAIVKMQIETMKVLATTLAALETIEGVEVHKNCVKDPVAVSVALGISDSEIDFIGPGLGDQAKKMWAMDAEIKRLENEALKMPINTTKKPPQNEKKNN